MLNRRLKAYHHWCKLTPPQWSKISYPPITYKGIIYYAAPQQKAQLNSLDEVDPEILATFKKLGISVEEQKRLTGVAVDMVMDSVSVGTTFKKTLAERGIVFCPFNESARQTVTYHTRQ